ncbi:MAG: hypothetical protein GY846_17025, partial [Deltaproteobacteria bacterium]|nr:hypothetical protein [Deltaproteobacteria bacterium]
MREHRQLIARMASDETLDALREIRTDSEVMEVWGARDALVLKALACVLGDLLDPVISEFCHHIKG